MKTFNLEHAGETYTLSLDMLATRNMSIVESKQHIHTDQIMLINGKRVRDFKLEFENYKDQGGQLKKKAFLDEIAMKKFGAKWDDAINFAKNNMNKQFNEKTNWVTKEDHYCLCGLAQSGHAVAAYNLGCQFMKQNDDMAVRALVDAHNYGHVAALHRLSGYLAKKDNYDGAIICLVISADCGADIAVMSIPHAETLNYLAKALSEGKKPTSTLNDLAAMSRYSTVRYLQLIMMLLTYDKDYLSKLNDIITCPQNPPKKKELDATYIKRGDLLKKFFNEIKSEITDKNGTLIPVIECIKTYKKIANKKHYCFVSFKDYMEIDRIFNS